MGFYGDLPGVLERHDGGTGAGGGRMRGTDENDPSFCADLVKSHGGTLFVAEWITRSGLDVVVNGLQIRPDDSVKEKYRDTGDLGVINHVEVNETSKEFEFADSFPFEDVLVEIIETWESKVPKPDLYVKLNKAKTHAALIWKHTVPFWLSRIGRNPKIGRDRPTFFCPLFYPLNHPDSGTPLVEFRRVINAQGFVPWQTKPEATPGSYYDEQDRKRRREQAALPLR
jgi:hypothetical protein